MSEVITEANRSRHLGKNILRIGGGLATFGFFTALGYKFGTEIFAKDAPSEGLEYAYTSAGVALGMIGGGFAGSIVATADFERSSLLARMRPEAQIDEDAQPAPEVQYSDDLSHMEPDSKVILDDPDLSLDWLRREMVEDTARLINQGALTQEFDEATGYDPDLAV